MVQAIITRGYFIFRSGNHSISLDYCIFPMRSRRRSGSRGLISPTPWRHFWTPIPQKQTETTGIFHDQKRLASCECTKQVKMKFRGTPLSLLCQYDLLLKPSPLNLLFTASYKAKLNYLMLMFWSLKIYELAPNRSLICNFSYLA